MWETTTEVDERNRKHKQMERHSVFMDYQNEYGKSVHNAPQNLQLQCNLCSNSNDIFIEIEKPLKLKENHKDSE
jgi:hypothetical protein